MSIVKVENVRVLDPINQTDSVQTVYIENGRLVAESNAAETIDGQGKWLMPSMVDSARVCVSRVSSSTAL
jgi:Predicted metal-dependent hydrolase with the TIM-barrel fold